MESNHTHSVLIYDQPHKWYEHLFFVSFHGVIVKKITYLEMNAKDQARAQLIPVL